MFDRRATCIAWLLGAPACMPAGASAEDANSKVATLAPEIQADAELLEYLGSVDAEGQEWMQYLADTDILQVVWAKKSPDLTEGEDQ
jgi:hypothetical protein